MSGIDATKAELLEIIAQLGILVSGDPTVQDLYDEIRFTGLTDEDIAAEVEEQRGR